MVAAFLLFGALAQGQTRIDIGESIHLVCNGTVNVVLEDTRFCKQGVSGSRRQYFQVCRVRVCQCHRPCFYRISRCRN